MDAKYSRWATVNDALGLTVETMSPSSTPSLADADSRSATDSGSPSTTRPSSPGTESVLANSLHQANATMDEITQTLSSVSRPLTPETALVGSCCCMRQECEHRLTWMAFKAKLEGRLILSAEVGQALLQKHEAYVRRHGVDAATQRRYLRSQSQNSVNPPNDASEVERLQSQVSDLLKENVSLQKECNTTLINSELLEAQTKTYQSDLEEAHAAVSRLAAANAKSVGWETRLSAAMQERDDLKQEQDAERQRAKFSEAKAATLSEKCVSLQAENRQLHEDLENQKLSRSELADEILQDARARLEMLQQSSIGRTVVAENTEVTRMMESLVADNEALKRDIAEAQNLLTESREDNRQLRDEVEELKAGAAVVPDDIANRPSPLSGSTVSRHHHTGSWQSSFGFDRLGPLSPRIQAMQLQRVSSPRVSTFFAASAGAGTPGASSRSGHNHGHGSRASSVGPSVKSYEPLTPDASIRPISPETNGYMNSPITSTFALPFDKGADQRPSGSEQPADGPDTVRVKRRPLLLLKQSRGVQTESTWPGLFLGPHSHSYPSDRDQATSSATPPLDGRSESSSLADPTGSHSSTIAALLDRVASLHTRLAQADALTLTNRLKRQHLTHADAVSHLSRTTVTGIVSEAAHLRQHFRTVLEDEKVLSTCTRRDLRGLLKVFKEMFAEMGEMRVTLNEVVLDPGCAERVREEVMNPHVRGRDEAAERGRSGARSGGWMAPLSRLFGSSTPSNGSTPSVGGDVNTAISNGTTHEDAQANGLRRPSGRLHIPIARHHTPLPTRAVPKSGAALAASTTTVNVEFSKVGGGIIGYSISSSPRSGSGTSSSQAQAQAQVQTSIGANSGVVIEDSDGRAGDGHGGVSASISDVSAIQRKGVEIQRPVSRVASRAIMGIFAGAPKPSQATDGESWVVLPRSRRPPGRINTNLNNNNTREGTLGNGQVLNTGTLGRSSLRGNPHRLSRQVDAVIDSESVVRVDEPRLSATKDSRQRGTANDSAIVDDDDDGDEEVEDFRTTLLERTLRPRGLSDSSIRSSYLKDKERERERNHHPQQEDLTVHATLFESGNSTRQGAYPGVTAFKQGLKNSAPFWSLGIVLGRDHEKTGGTIERTASPRPDEGTSGVRTESETTLGVRELRRQKSRSRVRPRKSGTTPEITHETTATAAPPMPVVPPPSLATNPSEQLSQSPPNHRPTSPNNITGASGLLQNVASWAASRAGFDSAMTEEFVGSFVDGRAAWAPVRGPREHDVSGSGMNMGMGREF